MKNLKSYQIFEITKEVSFEWLLKLSNSKESLNEETLQLVAKAFAKLSIDEAKTLFKRGADTYNTYSNDSIFEYLPYDIFNSDMILTEVARANNMKLFKYLVQPVNKQFFWFSRSGLIKELSKFLPKSMPYIDFIQEMGHKLSSTDLKYVYVELFDFRKAPMYKKLIKNMSFDDITTPRMRKNGTLRIKEPYTNKEYSLHSNGTIRRYIPSYQQNLQSDLLKQTNIQVMDKVTANKLIQQFILYFYRQFLLDNKYIFQQLYADDPEIRKLKLKRNFTMSQFDKFLKIVLQKKPDLKFKNVPINFYSADVRHLLKTGIVPLNDIEQFR